MAGNTIREPTPADIAAIDTWYWAFYHKIKLQAEPYTMVGHEYQVEPMQSVSRLRCYKKATQLGFTEIEVLRTLHDLIYGILPKGAMYLFPTGDDVSDFSKARFKTLLTNNPATIGRYVRETDAATIKQIGKAMLYLRGARKTAEIEGVKADSSKLRSAPVDKLVCDESDLMDPLMIDLAEKRLGHSTVQEKVFISSPSIPDFGIDKMYQESDQRVWMIKCRHCGEWTCPELEFPDCIGQDDKGKGILLCRKCHGQILSCDGEWCPQFPGKEMTGYWISRLNSIYADPWVILQKYLNPPNGNLAEVKNSELGLSHIDAENRLTPHDLWPLMGTEPMPMTHPGPTAMGVDVGNNFHVTLLDKPSEGVLRIVKITAPKSGQPGQMDDFTPLHDIAKQYNVKACVIDFAPVQKHVRAFRESEPYEVFGCIYQEHQRGPASWDSKDGVVRINRTECCDTTHSLCTTPVKLRAPRRNPEIEEWVKHMCNLAKVLEEDKETGSKEYHYRKLGPDHYRHSLNYAMLAAQRIGVFMPEEKKKPNWRGADKGSWKSQ